MSISVHEALQLPVMNTAKLLGGEKGIQNQIKWVTIVEVIEDINRFQEGEFLITTGFGLEDDSTAFQKLLSLGRLSGVALYRGFYLKSIPPVFIEIANEFHLPLLELPTEVNFSDVTKAILQEILNRQMEIAIESLKEEAVKQTQLRLQGEFLEELINRNFQSSSFIFERGRMLGFNLSLQQVVLQMKLEGYMENEQLKREIELLYHHSLTLLEEKKRQFIIRTRLDGLVILVEVKKEKNRTFKQDSLALAEELLEKWKVRYPETPLLIGVGKSYASINQLSDSANEAKYAVDLSSLLLTKKEIIHYDDLATFHLLLQMKEMGISLGQFYEEQIGELIQKSKQGIDFIKTLEVYFKNNLNLQSTAANLYIHRHTLKYRLQQIEKKTGYLLDSADERLKLQLAIAAYKLDQYFQ